MHQGIRHCGDHSSRMAANTKSREILFFQTWKNKSPGDLFFQNCQKQVPWGLVFSTSGKIWKNKSPGDLFFPVLEKQVPWGLVFSTPFPGSKIPGSSWNADNRACLTATVRHKATNSHFYATARNHTSTQPLRNRAQLTHTSTTTLVAFLVAPARDPPPPLLPRLRT